MSATLAETESALRAFPDPILVFSPAKEVQLQNAAGLQTVSISSARWPGGNISPRRPSTHARA